MEPWSIDWSGRLEERIFQSALLAGNPLGDPSQRPVLVYLPPGYDEDPYRRYPSIYVLQGYLGQVDSWRNRKPFERNFPEVVDQLFARGEAPPAVVVFVDAWTSLGGSQFLDSPATGRYHSYLSDEIVPWIDGEYRTLAAAGHRGVMGHSSGGYGAMVTSMLRPDLFGGFASHAGDALFELCYQPEFVQVVRALRENYGGSYERFWTDFNARGTLGRPTDFILLEHWCMAASYSADPDGSVHLPFDLTTGKLVPETWERWLAWDPVRMVPGHAQALRELRAIYLDAGRKDEYSLDLGAQAMHAALNQIGVTDVHFELFDGGHMGIGHRYPIALAYLLERLG
ncbi:MAG TPA: alpha/beta hydrolase-fold protein [Candidatus Dormibacteraeota bacterium]|nr:alpha/beta hydrolase-fold protein [Candidatus Dormibacteraeota bacterium]